ncbi:hypothetical protein [Aquimarina megaterium]|uniref:hypothetical protein n=1 Tax=Aquimarina megaterium TaxID=1443666 RepID=UPI0004710757|nr:hypothetical protein [Aquimarina megaterium]
MKQGLLTSITLLFCLISFAQSADLDKENFKVSYVKLPTKPILDDTKRTYSTNHRGISISGFSKVKSEGTLDFNYTFNGTEIGEVNINKNKIEKKDKEGKVISVSYEYMVVVTYSSSGSLSLNNAETADNFQKTYSESTTYKSSTFGSYTKAKDYYNNNRHNLRNKYRTAHKNTIISNINSYANRAYGYIPYTTEYEYLWILGSKKHPEFQKHHEAFDKVKASFDKIKYDEPIDEIKKEMEPIIEYFNSVIPNYPGDKRKIRKVRYASYYNIANLYYYLEMPEKVKEYAQKIIDNNYDKKDGKYFIKKADQLIKSLETNKTNTRHMKVLTEDLSNVPEEEEEKEEATDIELNKAYLITKENDTTMVDIKSSDIASIGYKLKTVEYDQNGTPIGSRVKSAKKCKELVFVDGLHYRNIKFKESSIKSGAVDAGQMVLGGATDKLCKVLFESDKINLYLFNESEMVILPAGSEKGKSTMAAGFVFGFKKNLTKYAEGCPTVIEKIANKEYKNNQESLLKFCNELTKCSSSATTQDGN